MATYATYRHVELDRVGVGKKRVLKPPGGGSSISFDEDSSNMSVKSSPRPQASPQSPISPEPQKEAAPDAGKVEQEPFPEPKSNGMSTPECVKENAATTTESTPTPSTTTTNGDHSPALNGPAVNGSSTANGSVSSGSTSSMSVHSSGTPKHLNTQNRIFGEEQNGPTPRRRMRDHERSNIFTEDGSSTNTHRPDVSSGSVTSNGTPDHKTPEQAQPQAPRQRVPPGGFSTKLW